MLNAKLISPIIVCVGIGGSTALLCQSGSDAQTKTEVGIKKQRVTLVKTPNGGIQPQAVVDSKGVVHLLYFKGDAAAGDLFYVRRDAGKARFSTALKVNSQAESAIAMGTIRGGQLAVGKNGRIHVAWNGSGKAQPRGPGKYNAPMLYTRLDDAGTRFEEQRNLIHLTESLDGGGTLAVDQTGNVYVAWHGSKTGLLGGEQNRKVWLALSRDEGKTFAEEVAINTEDTGACGCCGMRAAIDNKGNAYFVYRTATHGKDRGMFLLTTTDAAKTFAGKAVDQWDLQTCPMSSVTFAEGPEGIYVAWETDGQVFFAQAQQGTANVGKAVAAPGLGKYRKHPVLAVNAKSEVLLAWTEDTGWQRGGALAWQVYDKTGQATADTGRVAGGIAVWGLAAAIAEADGTFTLLH